MLRILLFSCLAGFVLVPVTGLASSNRVAVALGKLRPQGGVHRVAAPFSFQGPSIIAELRVANGETVSAGQVLARTHMHATAAAALAVAEAEVSVRQARLAIVQAGLKRAEITALAADADRERSQWDEATLLLGRAQRLHQERTISQEELEAVRTRWHSASNRTLAASERLAAGREVRDVDVALARSELQAAQAAADRARQELNQTEIRAPFAGEVLALHAHVGEVAANGLLDLGRTQSMEIQAEVYESDLRHIQPRQAAEIRGEAFAETVRGEVIEIGRQVRSNRLLNPDPAAFADNRVVEVILRLPPDPRLAGLSGALVHVGFLP